MENFEKDWKGKFGHWEVPPPDAVWDAIEKELDQKKKKPLVLFFSKTAGVGLAAALLLVGLWLGPRLFENTETLAKAANKEDLKKQSKSEDYKTLNSNNSAEKGTINANLAKAETKTRPKDALAAKLLASHQILTAPTYQTPAVAEKISAQAEGQTYRPPVVENAKPKNIDQAELEQSTPIQISKEPAPATKKAIETKKTEVLPKTEPSPKADKKLWLSLNTGVVTLNSRFGDNLLGAAFSAKDQATAEIAQTAQIASSPGTGSKIGVNLSLKMSKSLSFESGLSYIRANSYLRANAYAIDKFTGERNIFLTSFLSQTAKSAQTNTAPGYTLNAATSDQLFYVGQEQDFVNNFRFISIPNQFLWSVLKQKRLGLSIGTGFSADILAQNTIGDVLPNSNRISFNGSDGIYKTLSFSGLASARLSYKINQSWSSGFAIQGQRGLGNMLQPTQNTKLLLKQTSLSYGLQYAIK
jgi:hypothetical protein